MSKKNPITKAVWRTVLMQPEELQSRIEYLRASAGGFQRSVIQKHVNQIAEFLSSEPKAYENLPPALVAEIPGRELLLSVDGQQKTYAAIQAGVPLYVTIMPKTSIDDARFMFLPLNAHQKRLKWFEVLDGSTCPAAVAVKKLATDFSMSWDHILRLGRGVTVGVTSRFYGFTHRDSRIPAHVLSVMRIILNEWTRDERWKPEALDKSAERTASRKIVKATGSAYCVAGVLQAVGAVILDYKFGPRDKAKIVELVGYMREGIDWSDKDETEKASRNGFDHWCNLRTRLLTLVQRRLMQTTGQTAGRRKKAS